MNSDSGFPYSIHKGVKLFFIASMISLAVGIVAVLLFLWDAHSSFITDLLSPETLDAILVASTVLGFCILALQFIGVSLAAREEQYFRKARTALIISIVCSVISQFREIRLVELAGDIASLCASLFIIKGITNAALRLRNDSMYNEGRALFRAVLIVTFAPIGLGFLVGIIAVATSSSSLFIALMVIVLVAAVVVGIWELMYMGKAVRMTNPANLRLEEDPWNRVEQSGTPFDNNF